MEYMAYGDLLGFMRKSRGIQDKYHVGEAAVVQLQTYDLVVFAQQIAAGMVFLGARGVGELLAKQNVLTYITIYIFIYIYIYIFK